MKIGSPAISADTSSAPAVTGTVALFLRAEAAVAVVAGVLAYHALGGGWARFAIFILAPDLSMLGYFGGPRLGSWVYNAAHTYLAPAILGLFGLAFAVPAFYGLALIWVAHIGFDRLLGFGLKYPIRFGATHLG